MDGQDYGLQAIVMRCLESPMDTRLNQQLSFLNEIERLKTVYRRNLTADGERRENSAEHSWHVALFAIVLSEHANEARLDMLRVIKMLLIHDLVEVYAGDTWVYDTAAVAAQEDKEIASAERLFGMLPEDQRNAFLALWHEFEARRTPEAKFAASLDALQPLTNHLLSGKVEEAENTPRVAAVRERKRHMAEGSDELWRIAQQLIDLSAERGLYRRE